MGYSPKTILLFFCCLAFAWINQASAGAIGSAQSNTANIRIEWNRDLLARIGLRVIPSGGHAMQWSAHHGKNLSWPMQGNSIVDLRSGDGKLPIPMLLEIAQRGEQIKLVGMRVQEENGPALAFRSADGKTWLVASRLMHSSSILPDQAIIRSADLRIAKPLAEALGLPRIAGWTIAELRLHAPFNRPKAATACGSPNWHGLTAPGDGRYQTDVFMQNLSAQFMRCRNCDGPAGSDGEVVIAPNVSLSNNLNQGSARETVPGDPLGTSTALWAADVPWNAKFSGTFAPYHNDQHPYLIWNLYRLDANGAITQIGRSGAKHAFLANNNGAECEACNGNNVLGRACRDTYGIGSNDSTFDLGPRGEIAPASGIWGRCGSIYDPNCDGIYDDPADDYFAYRLIAHESQIAPESNPGANWLLEAWYAVRDDIDIFNSMATRPVSLRWSAPLWEVDHGNPVRLGSAIDRWIAIPTPGQILAANQKLATTSGQMQVALRVTAHASGFRYDYAIMNYDFAQATLMGTEPNVRIIEHRGITAIRIPKSPWTRIVAAEFADGDQSPGNDWTMQTGATWMEWQGPASTPGLSWGNLYRFSIVADAAPWPNQVALNSTAAASTATFEIASYGIGTEAIFRDQFE